MMRKKQILDTSQDSQAAAQLEWLNLNTLAQVEFSSESPEYPIEEALEVEGGKGWRSALPGKQSIRIVFDTPQTIHKIFLLFEENVQARTQEFVLRYLSAGKESFHNIVLQQYTFSPPHTTNQLEVYQVDLTNVQILELEIIPDINTSNAFASLKKLKLSS
ncbi:hypothetical protein [Xanthocytophaga agilis]|uniref:Carbohydrate-binding protein n=1 Tax=Xanthocytophaga agilis TaxID=3048010 RepID=A0AAE3UER6_9BACT|nr:hypothetical protein [Xanthocytophaga agilis]MDJ1501601.1 hypothetical protein [Xanthocytophaga agilis]